MTGEDSGGGESKTYTYFYDNEDIIVEYLTKTDDGRTKTTATRYVHGPGIDAPLAIEQKGEVYYYHSDGLGSITTITDARQKTVESYTYDSYGTFKRKGDRVKSRYTYTAREWDEELGLYYYRARYYDAVVGRFITRDPIGFKGGINVYNYVGGNSVNLVDPLGQNPAVIGIVIVGGYVIVETVVTATTIVAATIVASTVLISDTADTTTRKSCDNKCEAQVLADEVICRSLIGNDVRSRCWASVNERYGACRASRPIPPLVTW